MAVDTSLTYIQQSVRRYARKPDPSNATDDYINQKINYFALYILPELAPMTPTRKVLTFYTAPNIDTYTTNTTDPTSPLFDFKNRYANIHPPVFFAGIQGFYYQDRAAFYSDWPMINAVDSIGTNGDGMTTLFTGTAVSSPMLQNSVIFTSTDVNGNAIILVDYPASPINGVLGPVNQPQTDPTIYGSVNYMTGAFTVDFQNGTPGPNASIYIENINYQPAKPFAMLFYENTFTIRPVPDNVYSVEIDVDALPTELINAGDMPDINIWTDVYALGAAKLIFRDELDNESLQQIEPMFIQALDMARRPTLRNSSNVRTPSFYGRRNYNGSWFNGTNWPM
jgi:hypothetical protein